MSNIILLNGACGIGKSTTAKLLHQKIEHSFLWEKDAQRRNISHYKDSAEHKKYSGKIILDLTNKIIKFCIEQNIDLIFDGVLWEKEIIEKLIETTETNGGKFFHIYLNAPRYTWKERLIKRGINGSLTLERAKFFYDSLQELKGNLDMIEIDTSKLTAEKVCDKIIKI